MVQLDEDLYPLIIDQLLSGDQSDLSVRTEQQQCLASLCRTSQTWNALCLPKLYKDCLVGDLDTFVQDIESNPRKIKHLNRITTLRLYHPFNNAYRESCYLNIFAYGWLRCGMKTMPDDALAGFRWCKGQKEYGSPMGINVWLLDANQILEEAIQRYPRFLSKLEKVVMTGVGDYTYGDSHGLLTGKFGTSVIPNTLLELPSLEHYCQRAHGGLLALPNTIMGSRRVPKIVTFHPESMLTEYGKKWLPPNVLGTINRYMFNNGSFIGTRTDTGESLNLEYSSPIAPILQRIRALLLFREEVLVFDNTGFKRTPLHLVSLEGTTIELYNIVRHGNFEKQFQKDEHGKYSKREAPSDLRHIQTLVDQTVGRWRGKVFLKNKEECPPCSACGMRIGDY